MVIKANPLCLSLSLFLSSWSTLARTPPQLRCLCKGVVSSRLISGRIASLQLEYVHGVYANRPAGYIVLKIGRFSLMVSDDLIKFGTQWITRKGGFMIFVELENEDIWREKRKHIVKKTIWHLYNNIYRYFYIKMVYTIYAILLFFFLILTLMG